MEVDDVLPETWRTMRVPEMVHSAAMQGGLLNQ